MLRPDWTVCVELGRVDPPGAARRAMWDIGQAAQRRGRPPQLDPKGDRLLSNGGVEDLAGSPTTGCGLLLPVRQNTAAQTPQSRGGRL